MESLRKPLDIKLEYAKTDSDNFTHHPTTYFVAYDASSGKALFHYHLVDACQVRYFVNNKLWNVVECDMRDEQFYQHLKNLDVVAKLVEVRHEQLTYQPIECYKLFDAETMDVMFFGQLFTKHDVETIASANKWKLSYADGINGIRR